MGLARILGFAVVIATTSLAAWASPALASTIFETETYPGLISGKQVEGAQVLTVDAGKVECSSATFTGELAKPAGTLTLVPKYSGCTAFGFAASVAMGGCVYVFHAGEETGEKTFAGTTDISCPPGGEIVITTTGCVVRVGGQSGLGGVVYEDKLGEVPPDVKIKENIGEVSYSMSGGICSGSKKNGKYGGNILVEATREGESGPEAQGVAVAKDAPTKLCEEKPNPDCKKVATGKTMIEAPGSSGQVTSIGSTSVLCTSTNSKLTMKTDAQEGEPLNLETFSMTFVKCEANKKTACGIFTATSKPTASIVASAFLGVGNGDVFTPLNLRIECKGELNCEYSSTAFSMHFTGGSPGNFVGLQQGFKKETLGGGKEENCAANAKFSVFFGITTPKAIWVSR